MATAAAFIVAAISHLGYAGIVILMAIESACVPLPSEVILPFSGYLVATGRFQLAGVAVAGAIGCNLGSMVAYAVGYVGGRPLAFRYGRMLWVSPADLESAECWVRRRGNAALFVSRMLPVVRTFIALPAGIVKMPLSSFHVFTFLGSLPWCLLLAWIGFRLGQNWTSIGPYFHRLDMIWLPLLALLAVFAIWHHARQLKRPLRTGQ